MFLFLLYIAYSAEQKEEKRIIPKAQPKNKEDKSDKLGEDNSIEDSLSHIVDSINATELIDILDKKADELIDNLKEESKVLKQKAFKEIRRGSKRLVKKLRKSLIKKRHHK